MSKQAPVWRRTGRSTPSTTHLLGSHLHQARLLQWLPCASPLRPEDDEAAAFFSAPAPFLEQRFASTQDDALPCRLVAFVSLSSALASWSPFDRGVYFEEAAFFHSHFPETPHEASHLVVYARRSAACHAAGAGLGL